ncbi:PilZ domain-containing protein [Chitinimonas lacunae]|uniref:PilZ domain-containing protein n=1 Tax=Chitinimonas lacunae TaxID=1963018 RepID=A0ABV8MKL8_9NEIS
MSREMRNAKRVPIECPARIRTIEAGPTHYGTCTELSVSGMTLQSSFVPRPDEELDITVMPPRGPGLAPVPMNARVKVRRCHEIERGKCYEIGVEILKILS